MSQKASESDLAAAADAAAAGEEYILNTPELWGENHFPLPPDHEPDPYSEEKVSNASQPPQLIHQSNIPIDSIEQKTEYPKLYIKAFGWNAGETLVIDYNEDDTIEKVKQKISDITGYESRDMRLLSNPHGSLNGARTLKSYGIEEGQVIHLIRHLREGGRRRKRKTRKRRKKRKTKRRKTKKKSVKKRKKTKRRRKRYIKRKQNDVN